MNNYYWATVAELHALRDILRADADAINAEINARLEAAAEANAKWREPVEND